MEDISRELEREIARAKPAQHKRSRKKRILIVDDFGEMRSGAYLRALVKFLWVSTIVFVLASAGFAFLYFNLSKQNLLLEQRLAVLEEKEKSLVEEKEVLMARLVISGKEPRVEAPVQDRDTQIEKQGMDRAGQRPEPEMAASVAEIQTGPQSITMAMPQEKPDQEDADVKASFESGDQPSLSRSGIQANGYHAPDLREGTGSTPLAKKTKNTVAVEKFNITRDGVNTDLLVGFDIRNVSDKPGEISGRIFAVLKPDGAGPNDWLVVPTVPLENGVPAIYKKGQYFSIAHFKPVRFRIENAGLPRDYKKAAVYIFNESGEIMSQSFMDIQQGAGQN